MEYWDHTMGPRERVALRASAVQAVSAGEKKLYVARRLGITRQTLHNWVIKYQSGGTKALAGRPRGRSRREVLEPWQEAQVAGAIMLLPPSTAGEQYTRWTKNAIAAYVEKSFGIRFNLWQVNCHLRRWGIDADKPVRQAFMNKLAGDCAPRWLPTAPAEVSTQP